MIALLFGALLGPCASSPLPVVPRALVHTWDLKEVRYKDGRRAFSPQYFDQMSLTDDGKISWYDGCNSNWALFASHGPDLWVRFGFSTLLACRGVPIEDIHYRSVNRFELEGSTLRLHTASQEYLLERSEYSRLSGTAWLLTSSSIEGEPRYRVATARSSPQLVLEVVEDRMFRVTDVDQHVYEGHIGMDKDRWAFNFSGSSRARLNAHPGALARRLRLPEVQWFLTDYDRPRLSADSLNGLLLYADDRSSVFEPAFRRQRPGSTPDR